MTIYINIYILVCFLLYVLVCFHVFSVLEEVNQDHIDMAFDRQLMADQLLSVAGAKRKKLRVRNPDSLTGVGGSGSVSPSEYQSSHNLMNNAIDVDDVVEVESGRQERPRSVPLVWMPKRKESLPPSGSSKSIVSPSFIHGSTSQEDGNSEDPDGDKVGRLFTNYENEFLDTMASPND